MRADKAGYLRTTLLFSPNMLYNLPLVEFPGPSDKISHGTAFESSILYTIPVLSSTVKILPLKTANSDSSMPRPPTIYINTLLQSS